MAGRAYASSHTSSHTSSHRSAASTSSGRSYDSHHTQSTAATAYSNSSTPAKPSNASPAQFGYCTQEPLEYRDSPDARSSVETYASTVPSKEDLADSPDYDPPPESYRVYESDAVATTPSEFAALFPSTHKLLIRHDDSTSDGNMNLRVDTDVFSSGRRPLRMTLFHLRMRDLKDRKCSLRRYCRESGREVCSSSRKFIRSSEKSAKRTSVSRSLTGALQNLTRKSGVPKMAPQSDSGYQSDDDDDYTVSSASDAKPNIPTSSVRLEFTNYAQVEVHRNRTKVSKRYDFEYWGTRYHWLRELHQQGERVVASFDLINTDTNKVVAYITPEPLSSREAAEEEYCGGWVPPCSMRITDRSIADGGKCDLADVIVATGLIALVDDCIKRRWHSRDSVRLEVPAKRSPDYVNPKRLIDEIFHRRGYTAS